MRIKDYTDMVGHLTDSFNIPEARRMIAENPALSREQFAEGQLVQPGPGRQGYEVAGFVKPATKEVRKLAIEKFGIPFEELDTQRRSRLRTERYSERPPGKPRAPTLPEHEKIAQKLYNKSFDELARDQRHRIRVGRTTIESGKRPLDLMSSAERVKYSRERIKKFVDAFKKENKRLPFLEEIRSQGNFDFETIKKAEAEGIVKIGKAEGFWKYAKTKKVDQDVLKLSKNEKLLNAVKKGELPNLSDISEILKVDKNVAANRSYQLAAALSGDRKVEGISSRYKKGAEKILNNPQGYTHQLRRLAELKIRTATGENIIAARRRAISNYPDKELGLKYSIDEPAGIISSAKRGTAPYGIFSQVIDKEVNRKLKSSFDSRKSIAEKKLQNVIATGNKKEIGKEVRKFNQMVSDYEERLNKNLKPDQKKIKLFKVSLDSPEKTIVNFAKLSDPAKKAFKNNYKTRGYSFKVPSDIKPLSTIAQDLKNPKIASDISRRAALGEARLYSFPANLPEMAKMADPRKLPGDIAHLGKAAATKFPKTTAVLKSIFETKTTFGAAFWALEAPLLMLQGTYDRYANERDFKKALKRMELPDQVINQLGEVYGQELADIGQVGLESWAVDQPDTFETRKILTEEMAEKIPHFETRQAGPEMLKSFGQITKGEREIQDYEEQLKQQEIEKRTREAYEKYQGRRGRREGGIMGLKK